MSRSRPGTPGGSAAGIGATGSVLDAYSRARIRLVDRGGRPRLLVPAAVGTHGDWPFPGAVEAWVVTAFNPRSRPVPDGLNRSADRLLRAALAASSFEILPCTGFDPDPTSGWEEPSYLVVGAAAALVLPLAEWFDQNAVYRWTPGVWEVRAVRAPLGCVLGWRIDPAG